MPAKDPREAMLQAVLADDLDAQLVLLDAERKTTSLAMPDHDLTDAKIAAAEARTDTKFAELRGDLARLPSTTTLVATAIAIIGIILTALAYGGDRLQMGIGLADARQAQLRRDEAQDKSVQSINAKLDTLIAAQKKPATK